MPHHFHISLGYQHKKFTDKTTVNVITEAVEQALRDVLGDEYATVDLQVHFLSFLHIMCCDTILYIVHSAVKFCVSLRIIFLQAGQPKLCYYHSMTEFVPCDCSVNPFLSTSFTG